MISALDGIALGFAVIAAIASVILRKQLEKNKSDDSMLFSESQLSGIQHARSMPAHSAFKHKEVA